MRNLAALILRYKSISGDSELKPLAWGDHFYYRKNSNVPLMLDRTYQRFKVNKNGEATEIVLVTVPTKEGVKYGEIKYKRQRGTTLGQYYPWPYFPNKTIASFECVRLTVGFKLGKRYIYDSIDKCIYGDFGPIPLKGLMDYPEFFKPIYVD